MSMKTSIVYGYGEITTMQLVEFLKKHLPKDYKNMMKDLADDSDKLPTEEAYEEWLDGRSCLTSGVSESFLLFPQQLPKKPVYVSSMKILLKSMLMVSCLQNVCHGR